ncbi:MAG: hypothetical protein AABM30_08305 [Actinomycetota bacterium]
MPFEGVEALVPEAAIGLEPSVDLGERLRANAVQAPLCVLAHIDEYEALVEGYGGFFDQLEANLAKN